MHAFKAFKALYEAGKNAYIDTPHIGGVGYDLGNVL